MTREEFESNALSRLRDLYPQAHFLKAGQLEIAILRTPSGKPTAHRLRLARAWAAFCRNGAGFDLDTYLTRVVGTIERRMPPDWERARSLVHPKLITQNLLRRHPRPLFYPLAEELGYVLACDEYELWLSSEHLETWDVPEECALAAAMNNLQKLWDEATVVAWTVQDAIRAFHVEVTHHHKPAFLLLPEFYERAVELLDTEDVLVALPNRNFLVTFGTGDDDFRQILDPIVKKEVAVGYPLSPFRIRLDGGTFAIDRSALSEDTH